MREKHTIQDGTIPPSGLSPSVVCRQWGHIEGLSQGGMISLPIACTSIYAVVINDQNNNGGSGNHVHSTLGYTGSSFTVYSNTDTAIFGHWVAICIA